mgnify:CR=1 FL=1
MDWRYEVKYVLRQDEWSKLQQILVEHPASFRTAFPDRIVNNIYLDTTDFVTCNDNLAGISERQKYRIRWYGNANEVQNPVLEVKIKNNALGRKEISPIENWSDDFLFEHHLTNYGQLNPVLQNQYLRSYYVNWEGNFRLTVDRAIKYKRVNGYLSHDYSDAFSDEHIIVEIKFKAEDFKQHEQISRYFSFRPSKHSKYVTGVFYCYG